MDRKGEPFASLSISGPIFRLSEEQKEANVRGVLAASAEISTLLGFSDREERLSNRNGFQNEVLPAKKFLIPQTC